MRELIDNIYKLHTTELGVSRIKRNLNINEEEVLEKDLKGYKEYKKKVKYRLIPFIW